MRGARAAVAALLLGCAHAPPAVPRDHPAPAAEELVDRLEQRHRALRTLELETRTTSWLGGDRVRATVLMQIDRPGRLRFEAEVPVEGEAAALAVNPRGFTFLDLEHHVFRQGPACPANVALLIPIPLLPDELAAILLGDAPLGRDAHATGVEWDGERRADVLVIDRPSGGAAARLWVSFVGSHVVAVAGESPPGAGRRWRVAYDDLTRAGEVTLPGLIRFAEPGRSFDQGVEIKVKERIGVNRPLRDESFTLTAPPGFKVEDLPCGR